MPTVERAWARTNEELLTLLRSRAEGLSQSEAEARRRTDGPNSLAIARRRPWRDALVQQLRNPMS